MNEMIIEKPIETRVDRRVLRSRARIRAAFMQLVTEKPYSQITVKELAELADLNRKTFYMHYSSLDDVLAEVEEMYVREIERILSETNFATATVAASQLSFSLQRSVEIHDTLLRTLGKAKELENIRSRVESATIEVLRKQLETRTKLTQLQCDYLSTYLGGGLVASFLLWVRRRDNDTETLTRVIYQLLVNGLCSVLDDAKQVAAAEAVG
jgi:AcrR family transcriptional regulator